MPGKLSQSFEDVVTLNGPPPVKHANMLTKHDYALPRHQMNKDATYTRRRLTVEEASYLPPPMQNTGETPKPVKCEVEGSVPDWVEGSLVRIGYSNFTIPVSEDPNVAPAVFQHIFDGLGALHKFDIHKGQVTYNSRFSAEGILRKAKKMGYVETTMFGLNCNAALKDTIDPCSSLLKDQSSMFFGPKNPEPDILNVNVVVRNNYAIPDDGNPNSRGVIAKNPARDELQVMTDFNVIQVLDRKSLEPKRLVNYTTISPELQGWGTCAHPAKDNPRGEIYNYLNSFDGKEAHVFALDIKASPAKLLWNTLLPCDPCYAHAIGMTGKYVLYVRNPVRLDTSDVTRPVMDMFEVELDRPTVFYVLDKKDGRVVGEWEGAHFTFFHMSNGYDYIDPKTGDEIIHVDICSYEAPYMPYREASLSNVVDPSGTVMQGYPVRYELRGVNKPRAPGSPIRRASVRQNVNISLDFPRINKLYSMNPESRYVWGLSGFSGEAPGTLAPVGALSSGLRSISKSYAGNIVKLDWVTGKVTHWRPQGGESNPCEPIFLPRPGATEEDDGVVLSVTLSRDGTYSFLIVLDGKDLSLLARAPMPQVQGFGPHGTFVDGF